MLGLEESRLELESVWSSVNLLNIVTDKLEMDRFAQVNLTQLSSQDSLFSSVVDPPIHASDRWILIRIRLRILIFSSAYYFLKVHLHYFVKIKSPKEDTKQ